MDQTLFAVPPVKNPGLLPPLTLAYIGDAIYEVFVRQHVIARGNLRPNQLHRQSTRFVSAKAQARSLEKWLPHLSEEEQDIVRRGRNAKSATVPRNADVLDYRHSTAFECLVGYLYYKGCFDRLQELLQMTLEDGTDVR